MSDINEMFCKLSLGLFALCEEAPAKHGAGTVICITSAKPGEGKTFIASGLAANAASLSKHRILLVDANFNAPQIHKLYPSDDGWGLSDFLAADAEKDIGAVATGIPNFFAVTVGTRPRPELLYRRAAVERFIELARAAYDIVIFDCAPTNSVGGNAITEASDKILLVIDASSTRRELVQHSVRKIAADRSSDAIWGAVLNKKEQYLPSYIYSRA